MTEDDNTVCVLCRFHGQDCTYKELPKSRKRALSDDLASPLETSAPKRSRVHSKDPGRAAKEYDALEGPSLLKRTLGLQNLHHSRYVGVNDSIDPYATTLQLKEPQHLQRHSDASSKVRFVHPLHAFRIVPDLGTPGHDREAADLDSIERTVGAHGPELVRLYFRIVHPAFPVLHKDVFLEKYTRTHKEFAPPCLAAVYLLASGYWNFSETLSAHAKPDFTELRQLARSSLRGACFRPKLSTVQAALLISQYQATYYAPGTTDTEAGALTTQLVDLAYTLGLHLDPGDWDIPEWEIGLRRRLSWAVYTQDKWTALLGSRPPMITEGGWDVDQLTDFDFPEHTEEEMVGSSEVMRGRLVFMRMTGLAVILSAILRDVFGPKMQRELFSAPNPVRVLLERLKPLQIELKDWSATLPDSLKMDTFASMKLSSVGYLRLAYLAVESSIHRKLLRVLAESADTEATLWTVCCGAAQERFAAAIDFVQHLQAQHLASFWYSSSAHCCVLVYHLGRALQTISTKSEVQRETAQKLEQYKWTLKINGDASASFMKQALNMIDQANRLSIVTVTGAPTTNGSPYDTRDNATPCSVTSSGAQAHHHPMRQGEWSSPRYGIADTGGLEFSPIAPELAGHGLYGLEDVWDAEMENGTPYQSYSSPWVAAGHSVFTDDNIP